MQPRSLQSDMDASLLPMTIADFLPGLISETDEGDLPPGASPDCQNVYFKPGRLLGRKGYVSKNASLPAIADGIASFYDSDGTKHICLWSNGNFYDVNTTSFALTLVQASCYSAGTRITWTILNRVLYFSDGTTITTSGGHQSGIRYYDPVGTPGSAPLLITSGTAGTIETPAAKVLATRSGQLVLGNIKYVGGTYAKDSVLWSNVADPTTIVGTNIYRVGEGQGGEINCIVPMAISSAGFIPTDALFCGLSEFGVFMLKGALSTSTLTSIQLNCAAGVLDGATAKYIPGPGSAFVAFLATDRKVYYTNGYDTDELSKAIRTELREYIEDRYTDLSPVTPKFTSARNEQDHHYILDLGGGRQYIYDWDHKYWTRYNNWVSGYWIESRDANSNPALYVTSHTATSLVQQNSGTTDGGSVIEPYWKTQWLNAGDADLNKIYKWAYLSFRTDEGNVTLTATVKHGQGSQATATFAPPAASSSSDLWDSAIWDSATWSSSVSATQVPYKQKRRLFVQETSGQRSKLQGYDVQLQLSQSVAGWYEVLNLNVLFLPGGRKHVAA